VAIEVKGGLVHALRGAFRQLIAASGERSAFYPSCSSRLSSRAAYEMRAMKSTRRIVPCTGR
jgi:hypothetical protein